MKCDRILLGCMLASTWLLSGGAWAQVVTEFSSGITAGANPVGITAGPDGNLWFTEVSGNRIGRITPLGVVTEFSVGITGTLLEGITTGPDGNLWFTEFSGNQIGRITPLGVVTEFSAGISAGAGPSFGITAGPDGNLWFTEQSGNRIGRITTGAAVVPPSAVKFFGAATIPLNGSTSLTFTITNPNASSQVSGVFLNDSLPAGLVVSTPNGLVDGCNGVSAAAGSGTIFLNDIILAANTSCTYSVNVTGTTLGLKNNVTNPITSDQGTGSTASASVTVVAVGPPPPPATNIPTLQQWALWLLGLLILVTAAAVMSRQRRRD
jgi:IPTL-CTERM motif